MKIAYFDCSSGISGDMTVGAFLDAGLKPSLLKKRLGLLNISGYKIGAFKESRNGIFGTRFDVKISKNRHFKKSSYRDIKKLIDNSRLDANTKAVSISIFETLAAAEAKVHNKPKADVHFHEVGDLDSIIDVVSTAIAVVELDIREFYCLHLKLALPAPAVLEMLKTRPVSFADIDYELVTPTGAAILTTLVKDFNLKPEINIETVGHGVGTFRIKEIPNLLRVIIGNSMKKDITLNQDEIIVIETNIDDMSPVLYEYLLERLFEKGALDAYLTSVYMKKTRPGTLLTVLAKEYLLDTLVKVIMKETTSSGIRYYRAQRKILDRSIKILKTKYGPVSVKVNSGPNGIRTISPEYEDCKALAKKTEVPFKVIFDEARKKID